MPSPVASATGSRLADRRGARTRLFIRRCGGSSRSASCDRAGEREDRAPRAAACAPFYDHPRRRRRARRRRKRFENLGRLRPGRAMRDPLRGLHHDRLAPGARRLATRVPRRVGGRARHRSVVRPRDRRRPRRVVPLPPTVEPRHAHAGHPLRRPAARQAPLLHRHRGPDAHARHRRDDRRVQRDQRRAHQAPAVSRSRAPRDGVENDRINSLRYLVAPANYEDGGGQPRWNSSPPTSRAAAASAGAEAFHANVIARRRTLRHAAGHADVAAFGEPTACCRATACWCSATRRGRRASAPTAVVGRTFSSARRRTDHRRHAARVCVSGGHDAWRPAAPPAFLQQRAQHFLSVVGRIRPAVSRRRAAISRSSPPPRSAHPDERSARHDACPLTSDRGRRAAAYPPVRGGRPPAHRRGQRREPHVVEPRRAGARWRCARRWAPSCASCQLVVEGLLLSTWGGGRRRWRRRDARPRGSRQTHPRMQEVGMCGCSRSPTCCHRRIFALAPARGRRADVQHDLREAGRGTIGRARHLRRARSSSSLQPSSSSLARAGAQELLARRERVARSRDDGVPDRRRRAARRYDNAISQFYGPARARRRCLASGAGSSSTTCRSAGCMDLVADDRERAAPVGEPPEVGYRTASLDISPRCRSHFAWPRSGDSDTKDARRGRQSRRGALFPRSRARRTSPPRAEPEAPLAHDRRQCPPCGPETGRPRRSPSART